MDADEIPSELADIFKSFNSAIDEIDDVMKPLSNTSRSEMLKEITPLEAAKFDLVCAYSMNSLFWMYLITQGVDPKTHDIKGELDRIKSYMGKVREIEDRKNAPKLQKEAAKRFVRNAMFDVDAKNQEKRENLRPQTDPSASTREVKVSEEMPETVDETVDDQPKDEQSKKAKKASVSEKRKHKKNDKARKRSKKARSES